MSALVPTRDLVALADLFDPIDERPLHSLLAEHRERRAAIARVAEVFADPAVGATLGYYVKGAGITHESYLAERMFDNTERARKALDADFWSRALDVTDVLSIMPATRRDEWRKQIDSLDVPEFSEAAIRTTLAEHLAARHRYFAERVDGLWRALSPDHKTNIASGFRSKMIITGMVDGWYRAHERVDVLVDLRVVVGRFTGRTDIGDGSRHVRRATEHALKDARRNHRGQWVALDGGAIEIRLYKNGNCHVRVADEIAWRLNAVLASLHPGAIPESNRTRPAYTGRKKKSAPKVELLTRPLPFAVLAAIAEFDQSDGRLKPNEWAPRYGRWDDVDKRVRAEVLQVFAMIGGVFDREWGRVRFDYDATEAIAEIITSGCVPDKRAHQFFPTPRDLAERVVALADIGPDDLVLEPSAGQGALADLLPSDRTVCVEASALHCAVLRAKDVGDVVEGDFLATRYRPGVVYEAHKREGLRLGMFDRVVMNPPFARGQWRSHVEHAADFVKEGGSLVAVLPASAPGRLDLPGFSVTWSETIIGAFAGTSVAVVILKAVKP